MENNVLAFFETAYVYDLPLKSLKFDFEGKSLYIGLWDIDYSDNDRYVEWCFSFKGITSFFSDYPSDIAFAPDGCYSVECSETSPGQYRAVWLFQINNQPLWEVRIGFTGLEIEGGLSPEAAAFRDKLMES